MTLPLEEMTREEKLRIMEALWADLTRKEEEFFSPNWHNDVLKAREKKNQAGQEEYRDWEEVKKELRNRLP